MLIQATLFSLALGTSVEGGLDKTAVREVVRANIDDVRECYNAELGRDETVEGRVVVSFVVQPDGKVTNARVSESTMPKQFDACLAAAVAGWAFPTARESTSVTYPFEMSPG
jgi:TonB family protein